MILARSSWKEEWNTDVYAGDASLTGCGISRSTCRPSKVAVMECVSEQQRWQLRGGQANEHVFLAGGLAQGADDEIFLG